MADIFNKWKEGLARTSKAAFGRLATLFGATQITPETWDEMEAILIQADLGVDTTQAIIAALKKQVSLNGLTRTDELQSQLRSELLNRLNAPVMPQLDEHHPAIILIVGVNGSGKTTTIAKLARQYSRQGKKVLLAAADTYRAAAVDQLQVWGERLNIPVIAGAPESDPGAVAFNALQAAQARKSDLVFVDTAGRLHTRFNLMEELKKVDRVIRKALPGAPHACWLVLDATT